MIVLAEPDPSDMVQAIKKAMSIVPKIDPQAMHLRVSAIFKMLEILLFFRLNNLFSYLFSFSVSIQIVPDAKTVQLA